MPLAYRTATNMGDGSSTRRSSSVDGFPKTGSLRTNSQTDSICCSGATQSSSQSCPWSEESNYSSPTRTSRRSKPDLFFDRGLNVTHLVEVAGIEPVSSGISMGLLRAQPARIVGGGTATGICAAPYPTKISLTISRATVQVSPT